MSMSTNAAYALEVVPAMADVPTVDHNALFAHQFDTSARDAAYQMNPEAQREQIVQTLAVGFAWLEHLDRLSA